MDKFLPRRNWRLGFIAGVSRGSEQGKYPLPCKKQLGEFAVQPLQEKTRRWVFLPVLSVLSSEQIAIGSIL